jgi:hypothetical protein
MNPCSGISGFAGIKYYSLYITRKRLYSLFEIVSRELTTIV